jgi:signal peptidase I
VSDFYAVLGVTPGATGDEIRTAYHRQLRFDDVETPEGNARMRELREAYEVLSDPDRRRSYDATRDGGDAAAVSTGEATAPSDEPTSLLPPEFAEPERVEEEHHHSYNPITRATRGLPRGWRITIDWIVTIVGAVAIVLAIKHWVINPYRIPSSSMEPTLHCARPQPGCEARFSDRVLANRFIYHFRKPHRGDIIVFKTPPQAKERCGAGGTFVKRLIGLPGERFEERNGYVYINGKKLNEPYVKPDRRDTRTIPPMRMPKGRYFMMGDNRIASCDSREWGPVPRKNIIGKVFFIYWPPNRISFVGAAIAFMGIAAFGAHRLARNFR